MPPITVLHVEDDEGWAELMRQCIEFYHDDMTVRTVGSGDDALAHLEAANDVDCIVSDYEMPEIDGLALLKVVRGRWPDLPFILFTGRESEDIVGRTVHDDITVYMRKRAGIEQFAVLVSHIRNAVLSDVGDEANRGRFEGSEAEVREEHPLPGGGTDISSQ